MLEYVLLIALVAMLSFGAMTYLGHSSGDIHQAGSAIAVGVSGGEGTSPSPASSEWCRSSSADCTDTIGTGSQQVISFWATGGTPPYTYSLTGNPSFVTLAHLDPSSGKGEVVIQPVSCSQVQIYAGITISISDGASPPGKGQLTFALTVAKGASC